MKTLNEVKPPPKAGAFFNPFLLSWGMDRAAMQQRLMEAEAQITEGQRRIALQQKLVRELDAHGEDSTGAKRLLAKYEESQALRIADRDRFMKGLEARRAN